jgi:hypothetical protein
MDDIVRPVHLTTYMLECQRRRKRIVGNQGKVRIFNPVDSVPRGFE